jgi:hypothetical protein
VRTTARVETRIELGDGGRTYTLGVTGDFDLARDRGRLAVDLPGGAVDHLDEVFVDGTVYVRGLLQDRPDVWGSIPRKDARAHYLLRAPLNDPEHVFGQLAKARVFAMVGEREVNGSPAFLYHADLDFPTLTHRLDAAVRARAERLRQASRGGDLGVRVLVWVDREGRVVQVEQAFRGQGAEVTSTTTLSDFGKPVAVTAPPADQVAPITRYGGVLPG